MKDKAEDLINKLMREKYEPIAVIGIGLRFPGNNIDLESFSQTLNQGKEAISLIPENRWNNKKYYHNIKGTAGKICTHSGGYISDFDHFDPTFFSISPKEANNIDPQQRLMLELAWEALENANINPETLNGSNGSVYIGASTIDYHKEALELKEESLQNQMGTGTANSAISGRISYFLGLRGPCLTLDTACSSSLVAIHLGMQGLRQRETDIALCGAVSLIHHPSSHIIFSHANMLAPDGRCKTFDSSADGYGRSEGAGILILKRLSDAIKDNNTIFALLRGSAVLQDGESGGLTVPNGIAQEQVMKKALENSLLEASDISYVEAHGTGTPLGDPIEMQAINKVFGKYFDKKRQLYVGSVKTNLGHMEAAAGLGGIIKAILQIRDQKIYPHLNLKNPNPHIPWDIIPIQVPNQTINWGSPQKRALINSFGFTGTISSIIVEEAPQKVKPDSNVHLPKILTISAKNITALNEMLDRYLKAAEKLNDNELDSFCYASNVGRAHFSQRVAALIEDKTSLIHFLEQSKTNLKNSDNKNNTNSNFDQKIAFLFTGQGAQYVGMGKMLYAAHPLFRTIINQCDELFFKHLNVTIKDIMFENNKNTEFDLNKTIYSQPALFSFEYALAELWISWDIKPSIVIGHSIGEIVAATIAEVFTLEDAIQLVSARAQLMQSINKEGSMLVVHADALSLEPYFKNKENVSFAAFNAPQQCVISGDKTFLTSLYSELTDNKILCKMLKVSHAFHSEHMDEILKQFYDAIKGLSFNEPALPILSNLTGKVATKEIMTPDYWVKHIRQPVHFLQGMSTLESRGSHIFIEIGPNPVLTPLGMQCLKSSHNWLPSVKINLELETITQSIITLYKLGLKINWQNFHFNFKAPISLPLYPFQGKRYWLPNSKKLSTIGYPLLGEKLTTTSDNLWEYTAEIHPSNPEYLTDHIVMNKIVFPGAGFLEMILELQDAVFGRTNFIIKDFYIHQPLFLQQDSAISVTTRLIKHNDYLYEFEIFSNEGHNKHVTGKFEKAEFPILSELFVNFPASSLSSYAKHYTDEIYNVLLNKGLEYGPTFKQVEWVEKCSNAHAKGGIYSPNTDCLTFLYPPTFDAVLHTIDAILHEIDPDRTYLPVGFEKFLFLKKPKGKLESRIFLKTNKTNNNLFDVQVDLLLLDNNEPVFITENLLLKTVSKPIKKINKNNSVPIYSTKWINQALNDEISTVTSTVFIDPLFSSLNNDIKNYLLMNNSIDVINEVEKIDDYLKINKNINSIVFFWKNTIAGNNVESFKNECEYQFKQVIKLIHLLEKNDLGKNVKLLFVTQGAQLLIHDNANITPQHILQSSLWGFSSVVNQEYPKYECKAIDFDPAENTLLNSYKLLIQELSKHSSGEFQIAYRHGKRFVNRLCTLNEHEENNFKLSISEYGTFSNVIQEAIPIEQPLDDQILVKICAAGINFKDILNVLGLLKQHAINSHLPYTTLPLGFECAGFVIAAGENAEFKEGDEVIISRVGCMQKYLTVSSKEAVRKPKNITFAQAAGIATAYITSFYALHHLAQIKSGDKILIHAAAGGVGQAAIQLAKRANAIIFATASEAKWDFLRAQGIEHIMNSRDLSFGDHISDLTHSEGVDIILNSLNKEYIPIGLKSLSHQGRFVEIGKIDVWDKKQVSQLRPDVNYYNFDLSEMDSSELSLLNKSILEKIVDYLEKEEIKPLPTTIYRLDEVQEAFNALSRGANIGKLVISFTDEESYIPKPLKIHCDRTYLITGGFGALGLFTAKWLAEKGAKFIALIGRSIPHPTSQNEHLTYLKQKGVNLISLQGDISNPKDIEKIFENLQSHYPPLSGIFHAAGVLEDGPIHTQSWQTFDKVFSPKIYGTWLLHEQSLRIKDLDFFISYSSIASITGSSGQVNYAAANAYIDSIMKWRSTNLGKPGLTINWGPWADIGMAANLNQSHIENIENKGMKFLKPELGMLTLFDKGGSDKAQFIIGDFDWEKYRSTLPIENMFFEKFSVQDGIHSEPKIELHHILSLPSNERLYHVRNIIRKTLSKILHFEDFNEIELNAKFSELGLDSLVSVEFKNIIEKNFNVSLNATLIFDYPSIPLLADHLLKHLGIKENKKKPLLSKLMNKLKDYS